MFGETLLVGGFGIEGDVLGLVLHVFAQTVHLTHIPLLHWGRNRLGEGGFVAAVKHAWVIMFLDHLGGAPALAGGGWGRTGRRPGWWSGITA